ncbi:MAG: mechanosensitive ion channel family protein [Bryobacteraceae bacterium]
MRLRRAGLTALVFIFGVKLAEAQLTKLVGSTAAPTPQPATSDTLNRSTPRGSVLGFLEACRSGNYLRASEYLDLSALPAKNRRRTGMEFALQLNEVLNKDPDFDVDRLSDAPEGNPHDLANGDRELVDSIDIDGRKVDIELQRRASDHAWVFAAETVASIPNLHALTGETEFEKRLPDVLVKTTFIDTALWKWIALILLVPALGLLGRLISRAALAVTHRFVRSVPKALGDFGLRELVGPIGLLLGVSAYWAGLSFVAPSALVRFYISRVLTLLVFMAVAWIVARLLQILSRRLNIGADIRQQALYSSVMPLALRVAKIVIFVIAVLATMSAWGYNTSTLWATLGVGSLAVALAAQKTLENFFGGVSVIGDRPVLVGDFCKVGDMTGTVEDIGLRSTRIRTLNRTLVTVPNSQFSTMTLENFAHRDKMFFHPTFAIRCDATPAQVRAVMAAFERILKDNPEIEVGRVPVRFTGIGAYSYNLEIFAYVLTRETDRYLEVQTELLLEMIDAVEAAGTGLAIPLQELTGSAKPLVEEAKPTGQDGRRGA